MSDERPSTQWFDVRDYGATGDDVIADTRAYFAALAAAKAAGGGIVKLMAGMVIDLTRGEVRNNAQTQPHGGGDDA